jgi:hypothetical protein
MQFLFRYYDPYEEQHGAYHIPDLTYYTYTNCDTALDNKVIPKASAFSDV